MSLPDTAHRERPPSPDSGDNRRRREDGSLAIVDVAVGPENVPASVRALSSLADSDYVDMVTLQANTDTGAAVDADATPEQWARAMFGDVPSLAERLIWRGLLGLRLSRGRSPDTVAAGSSPPVAKTGSGSRRPPGF
jgi:hypothetical protein